MLSMRSQRISGITTHGWDNALFAMFGSGVADRLVVGTAGRIREGGPGKHRSKGSEFLRNDPAHDLRLSPRRSP
jgi:hypothetical protein